jgi:uncharacterized protein (DUF1330 family)
MQQGPRVNNEGNEMPKGFWIVSIEITDPEGYKHYIAENANAFRKYGARFLVRGGKTEAVEGSFRPRVVVIEFKDFATALACYRSPEYAKAMNLRRGKAIADIVVTEGYDGPQPTD